MTEEELARWAKKALGRFDNMRIVGAGGEWSGNTRQGFMFNPRPKGPAGTTPGATGACCFSDGSCAVVTQSVCALAGGTYQGDGTVCTPDLCPVDCPRVDTICATFSLIEACSCITVNLNHYDITDISLNGVFELSQTVSLPDLVQWEGFGGVVRFSKFALVFCPGDPTDQCDVNGYIVVQCRRTPEGVLLHTITYSIEFFDVCIPGWGTTQAQIFRLNDAAGPLEFGIIENTETGCGPTGTGSGIAENGVVTVASGPC